MSDAPHDLLRRLVGGDTAAERAVGASARAGTADVGLLVAAAVLAGDARLLDRADGHAVRPRDRQLVVLARTFLGGDRERFDALVRDHLASYPDQLLAAWLAARTHRP